MKTQQWNQWLTLFANIGVIVGILILAVEIRLMRDSMISSAYQARAVAVQDWDFKLADSSAVSESILKFTNDPESLTDLDYFRLEQINLATFNRLDDFFYQYELGLISEEIYQHAFRAEMTVQIPRLAALGTLDLPYVQLAMRPSFKREIEKYLDGDLVLPEAPE